MKYTDDEKKVYGEMVDSCLLDGIIVSEFSGGWVWDYGDWWCGHKIEINKENPVIYKTREKCKNAVVFMMRNSQKLGYAQNFSRESISYSRRQSRQ